MKMNLAKLPCEVVYWCNYLTFKSPLRTALKTLEPGSFLTTLLYEGPANFTLVCLLCCCITY